MHSCIYVFIDNNDQNVESLVDSALEPFNEATDVAPYKDYLSQSSIRFMADHYKVNPKDVHSLAGKMSDWHGVQGGVDDIGLFALCTSNPNGKWDWYEIGGRWDGYITGRRRHDNSISRGNCILASTLLASPDLPNRLPAGIITPTGEWIDQSSVVNTSSGWFYHEIPKDIWCKRLQRILQAFPNHRVICVDVHF